MLLGEIDSRRRCRGRLDPHVGSRHHQHLDRLRTRLGYRVTFGDIDQRLALRLGAGKRRGKVRRRSAIDAFIVALLRRYLDLGLVDMRLGARHHDLIPVIKPRTDRTAIVAEDLSHLTGADIGAPMAYMARIDV